jgi:hypothetical protein
VLEEHLINVDELAPEQRDQMGQACGVRFNRMPSGSRQASPN